MYLTCALPIGPSDARLDAVEHVNGRILGEGIAHRADEIADGDKVPSATR